MSNQFDFDSLSDLYKTDPEQFRIITRQMIEDYIASIPDEISQKKCAGIQFKLDHELNKYHDPLARMNKMVEIFWQGVYQFNDALKGTIEINKTNTHDTVIRINDYKTANRANPQNR